LVSVTFLAVGLLRPTQFVPTRTIFVQDSAKLFTTFNVLSTQESFLKIIELIVPSEFRSNTSLVPVGAIRIILLGSFVIVISCLIKFDLTDLTIFSIPGISSPEGIVFIPFEIACAERICD